jgi:hypothetical protein
MNGIRRTSDANVTNIINSIITVTPIFPINFYRYYYVVYNTFNSRSLVDGDALMYVKRMDDDFNKHVVLVNHHIITISMTCPTLSPNDG